MCTCDRVPPGWAKYGFDVKMAIANDDDSNQLSQIDAFIQEGVCAVALNPVTSGPSAADVAALNKAGIRSSLSMCLWTRLTSRRNTRRSCNSWRKPGRGRQSRSASGAEDLGAKAKILVGTVGTSVADYCRAGCRFYTVIKRDPNAKVGELVNGQVEPTVSLQVATDMLEAIRR